MNQQLTDQLEQTASFLVSYYGVSVTYTHSTGASESVDLAFVKTKYGSRQTGVDVEYDSELADRAILFVKKSVITSPASGDYITHLGKNWRYQMRDSAGDLWRIYVATEEGLHL